MLLFSYQFDCLQLVVAEVAHVVLVAAAGTTGAAASVEIPHDGVRHLL
eukprot:CAMPEP_0185802826 /NCGR_PEP_ID=MMETSP1322-20130828/2220_1 /TAXON_ID=265543 /ORGANISM="Minutocellus polymorphus, Strain RCC2270" /LENGTH=47 /DNA_ID= /DNA_START= /DNA_END= /DNA_ORIENTATION=